MRSLIIGAIAVPAFASAGLAQADGGWPGVPEDGAPVAIVGPYGVVREPAGANHVVFRPAELTAFPWEDRLPIVLWGNGGCLADSSHFASFLTTIASHGFLVVTTAGVTGETATAEDLIVGLDWATAEAENPNSALVGKIDADRVAIMGQSCGGFITLENAGDQRVDTVALWNSAIELGPFRPRRFLAHLHGPTLYIDGGETDVPRIHERAQQNFDAIDGVPIFYGSRKDGGHWGTFRHAGGGEFANVAVAWLSWTLKADETAGTMFVGDACRLCTDPNWNVQRKGL